MKLALISLLGLAILVGLPASGSGAALTSRQQTIVPRTLPPNTPPLAPSNVSLYMSSGYGAWDVGAGTNEGRSFTLMPASYTGAGNAARLLTFFTMSDIHLTDKESPAEVPYLGWTAGFTNTGLGGLNPCAYSPVIFDTPHHLDTAVRTINALHRVNPFDFGMVLGDNCNASQLNEVRWFIDVMDGKYITPSSGAHLGTNTIDYQMPFQAAGLDPSIPWYEAIGNHDQYWMGVAYPTERIRQAQVGSNILDISTNGPLVPPGADGTGMYVGTVDGTTPYGDVVKWGLTNLFTPPPTVAPDTNRLSLTTDNSWPANYVTQFFNTVSSPRGHGFNLALGHTGSLAACYSFLPVTDLPIKMIVLDDTCKSNALGQNAFFYGDGWVDAARYSWLTNELQMGQDAGQLMIIATHIPILPQASLTDTNRTLGMSFYDALVESNLVDTLHRYPNLLMVMAGHRHLNVVTAFPSPDSAHPEYGFWEVETPSLRDFPRQFRIWDIRRNSDNTISIVTTSVDPQVDPGTCAWKSVGYGVGAARMFGCISLTDTSSHTYNVELVKQLTPAMQAKIAQYGAPLNQGARYDYDADGKADPVVYDAVSGIFSVFQSGSSYVPASALLSVQPAAVAIGLQPIPGDFDGDGRADPTVYDPIAGQWMSLYSSQFYSLHAMSIGNAYFGPVAGDFDGDQKSDPALYSPISGQLGVWLSGSGYALSSTQLGGAGWLNASEDYDGDGKTDPAVYQAASGTWVVLLSGSAYTPASVVTFGGTGCVPAAADYDGDGKADLTIFQPATGLWLAALSGQAYAQTLFYGVAGTQLAPRPADYDNDRKADLGAVSAATRAFYVWLSGSGYGLQSLTW